MNGLSGADVMSSERVSDLHAATHLAGGCAVPRRTYHLPERLLGQ